MTDTALFQPDLTEYVGTAAGHTIGMVIANVDAQVRELLHISEEYASLGILTSRTGAAAQAYAVDEAAKAANVELLIFELPRDTEGYSGHGNLIVLGARDVSDARRAVEIALTEIDKKAEFIYINEVGHMEMHATANAGPVLHQIFNAPLRKAFGFICAGPAGIGLVAADVAMKAAPVDIVWYGTPSINLSMTNEIIIGITGDYGAVRKAVDVAYERASELIKVFGKKPESILHFSFD
ncbi:MAG: propanediol utilization microcompartment protein PduB [Lachnospiraceae bacterium]|nr:propanediol utilization microcompartment protein PduB [Lachnospiraceae bacterium]